MKKRRSPRRSTYGGSEGALVSPDAEWIIGTAGGPVLPLRPSSLFTHVHLEVRRTPAPPPRGGPCGLGRGRSPGFRGISHTAFPGLPFSPTSREKGVAPVADGVGRGDSPLASFTVAGPRRHFTGLPVGPVRELLDCSGKVTPRVNPHKWGFPSGPQRWLPSGRNGRHPPGRGPQSGAGCAF